MLDLIYNYFSFKKRGATFKSEILSGITIYLSLAYVILTVPNTMVVLFPEPMQDAMLTSLTIATCIASGIGTLILGIYAKVPLAMAPSLSLSLFFTHTMVIEMGFSYGTSLAIIFLSGIIFLIITLGGWRRIIVDAIPDNLKYAITAGVGFFIAFIGLQKSKIVIGNEYTLVSLNDFSQTNWTYTLEAILTMAGVIFIAVLMKRHVHSAIFLGKAFCTIIAIPLGLVVVDEFKLFPELYEFEPVLFAMDFSSLDTLTGEGFAIGLLTIMSLIINIAFIDIFDSVGTLLGTGYTVENLDENIRRHKLDKAMNADALGTIIGACVGVPTVSIYAESSVGIAEGGKTGFSAVVAGCLFLLTTAISPVIRLIPQAATACTLIIVGGFMMEKIVHINFDDILEAIPSIFIIILIPLTYSIATGMAFGIISYTLISLFTGHKKEISPVLYALTVIFGITFFI